MLCNAYQIFHNGNSKSLRILFTVYKSPMAFKDTVAEVYKVVNIK